MAKFTLARLFEDGARRSPNLPITIDRPLDLAPGAGVQLTAGQVARLAEDTASRLQRLGVQSGHRVAVFKRQSLDISILVAAVRQLGAVPCLLVPDLDAETLGVLLRRLDRPHLITDAETRDGRGLPGDINDLVRSLVTITPGGADVQEHVLPQPRQPLSLPEDVALVTHTSGTTSGYPVAGGYPKLVGYPESAIRAHTNMQAMVASMLRIREVGALLCSFAHGRTYSALGVALKLSWPIVLLTDATPESAAEIMARWRPGIVETFPNVFLLWEELADHPAGPLQNAKYFVNTFDAPHPRTIQRLLDASRRRTPYWLQGYGTTETGPITIRVTPRRWLARTDGRCVGYELPGYTRVRLQRRAADPTGYREILTRTKGAARIYVGEPDRLAPGSPKTWWSTGDIGFRSRRGCIHLIDRAVDEAPEVRSALRVEDTLLSRLPQLREVVILPMADGPPRAVVCTREPGAINEERWRAATADLPGLGPRIDCRWEDLPRTSTWKIRRLELRRAIQEHRFLPAQEGVAASSPGTS